MGYIVGKGIFGFSMSDAACSALLMTLNDFAELRLVD